MARPSEFMTTNSNCAATVASAILAVDGRNHARFNASPVARYVIPEPDRCGGEPHHVS